MIARRNRHQRRTIWLKSGSWYLRFCTDVGGRRKQVYTEEEIEVIIADLDGMPDCQAVCAALFYCGLLPSEGAALKWLGSVSESRSPSRCPGESHLERALRMAQDTWDLINSISARAQLHEEQGL